MFPVDLSRPRTWAALAALLTLAVALAALAWRRSAPLVEVVALQPAPLVSTLQLSARVAAPNRVELGSTITGRVRSVAVREGDPVVAGQPLLALEADELAAVLDQAVAAERSAEARLQGLRSSGRATLQAGVAQAEAQLVAARADLARQQALVAQGFVSPARLTRRAARSAWPRRSATAPWPSARPATRPVAPTSRRPPRCWPRPARPRRPRDAAWTRPRCARRRPGGSSPALPSRGRSCNPGACC